MLKLENPFCPEFCEFCLIVFFELWLKIIKILRKVEKGK